MRRGGQIPALAPRLRTAAQLPGWAARQARRLLDPWEGRHRMASGAAVPPHRLRARTGAPGLRGFLEGGQRAVGELEHALSAAGRSLAEFESVLDFGCGSGRVLPQLAAARPGLRCTGCDVDPAAVAWAREHHPALRWTVSGFVPPLPFADASFDLVYSISVFSHLDEWLQDGWLQELARVVHPGGTALLSVHGGHAFEQFRTGAVRTRWCRPGAFARAPLGPDEFVFEPYVRSMWNRAQLPGVQRGYGLAFHGEAYLREHWGDTLEVIGVVERASAGWQDIVVCRVKFAPSTTRGRTDGVPT